ncbi:MAG: adenosylcobinamide-phosphate synthase CbiB [Methanoregulaceae archaeon]|nr:adenosylcobinamide-phosphate synthase CbiB [Methanoregulaceae archaeon]
MTRWSPCIPFIILHDMFADFVALNACLILLTLAVDRITGDPRNAWHPVALIGRFIGTWGRPEIYHYRSARFFGIVMWVVTVLVFTLPFLFYQITAPWYLYLIPGALFAKFCISWRALEEHTLAVSAGLDHGIQQGRANAALLVSRDTSILDAEQVRSAGYESLTENLVDSIISPLCFTAVFGMAGAALQRVANTMDAMLGYTDQRKELGWWSARADDVMNYIPARITGVILLIYFWTKGRFHPALSVLRSDGRKRPGYNGGIPMAVMAGGIGVCFEKPGVYRIGIAERSLEEAGPEILKASRVVVLLFSAFVIIALLLLQQLLYSTGI